MPDAETKEEARGDRLHGPTTLRHRDIEHVRKKMLADARDACHETRAAYVECASGVGGAPQCGASEQADADADAATGRTFSVAWACRSVFKDFNECLKQ